jgi:4-hydroxybenzoate polyprenyltransferase
MLTFAFWKLFDENGLIMQHRPEKENDPRPEEEGSPKFGRLLLVLLFAVGLIVALTFATEAFYSD